MKQSETIGELAKALAKAQGAIEAASKDTKNPHLRSKYADLGAVWGAIRAPLTSNGLSVTQGLSSEAFDRGWVVNCTTRLAHSSGEWLESTLSLPAPPQKGISMAQSIGMASTYARRYGLSAMVGVIQEDNDGHVKPRPKRETPAQKKARQSGHHPSWEADRPRFCAALGEMGWSLDQVKARIEGAKPGGKKPSEMTGPQRAKLYEMIHGQAEPFQVTR